MLELTMKLFAYIPFVIAVIFISFYFYSLISWEAKRLAALIETRLYGLKVPIPTYLHHNNMTASYYGHWDAEGCNLGTLIAGIFFSLVSDIFIVILPTTEIVRTLPSLTLLDFTIGFLFTMLFRVRDDISTYCTRQHKYLSFVIIVIVAFFLFCLAVSIIWMSTAQV